VEDLRTLRERFEGSEHGGVEDQTMTPAESYAVLEELRCAFAWQLEQTATCFEPVRFEAMKRLQERLRRLET